MQKFILDENIAKSVKAVLLGENFNVINVWDKNLQSESDEKIIQLAIKEERVIITHDKDFGGLLRYQREDNPGLILLRFKDQSPSNVIKYLLPFLKTIEFSKIKGKITVMREGFIKIVEPGR